MRRTVNTKLILILFGAALASGAALFAAHFAQAGRTADLFLKEARKAREAEDYERSIRSYRSHLKLRPDSLDARDEYGELLYELQDFAAAGSEFEHLLRLDPQLKQQRRRAAECALLVRRYSDCESHIERLVKVEEDAEVYEWMGRCQLQTREFGEATESLRKAIELGPDRLEVYALLSQLLIREFDAREEANEVVESLTANNPDEPRAYLIRSQLTFADGSREQIRGNSERASELFAEAESLAMRSAELDPEVVEGLLLAVRCASVTRRIDDAMAYANSAIAIDPKSAMVYSVLAELAILKDEREEAIKYYQKGIASVDPSDDGAGELVVGLASLYIDLDRIDEASDLIARLESEDSDAALVRFLRGRLDAREEKWQSAIDHLSAARLAMVNRPNVLKYIELNLGECYGQTSRYNTSIDSFRRAIALDGNWAPPRLGLVRVLEVVGQFDQAYSELEDLVGIDGVPPETWIAFVERAVTRNLRAAPGERDWGVATRILDQAEKLLPERAELAVLRAEIEARSGRESTVDLANSIDLATASDEQKRLVLLADVRSAQRSDNWDLAEKRLQRAISELPNDVEVKLAQASLAIARDGEKAVSELDKILANADGAVEDLVRLQLGLGNLAIQNDFEKFAGKVVQGLVDSAPEDPRVWSLSLLVSIARADSTSLNESIERLASVGGDESLLHYGRAQALLLGGESDNPEILKRSLAHLDKAKALRPAWIPPLVLEAEIFNQQGDETQASRALAQAIELGERSPTVIRNAALLLYRQREFQQADKLLRLLDANQLSQLEGLGRAASVVSIGMKDIERGFEVARATAKTSADAVDHVWHGALAAEIAERLRSDGEAGADELVVEALAAFRRASELAPESPVAWVRTVSLLVAQDRREDAIATTEEARAKVAPESLPLMMAQCFEQLGEFTQATEQFQEALEVPSADENTFQTAITFFLKQNLTALAQVRLAEMLRLEPLSDGSRVWARRQTAAIALVSGRQDQLEVAQELISENLAEFPASLPDLRARAIILSSLPGMRDEAIGAWESIAGREGVLPDDHYQFALLLESSGEWVDAAAEIRAAIAGGDPKRTSRYIDQYITWLLRRDELSDADLWLDRLRDRSDVPPGRIQAFEVELLVREGNHPAAVAALRQLSKLDQGGVELARTASLAMKWVACWMPTSQSHFMPSPESCFKRLWKSIPFPDSTWRGYCSRRVWLTKR